LLVLGVAEFGTRAILALRVGPSVLWYGTQYERRHVPTSEPETQSPGTPRANNHTVMDHGFRREGYTKYFANQIRVDHDPITGEVFKVRINKYGFRGDDYSITKPAGTLRVVTLGASSTFGYYDHDKETYPVYLEEALNLASEDRENWEVINLGIPHSCSWNVVEILKQEALRLEPDYVTLYLGINDAARQLPVAVDAPRTLTETMRDITSGTYQVFRRGLVVLALLDSALRHAGDNKRLPAGGWDRAEVEARSAGVLPRYFHYLDEIRDVCRAHGIRLVVANQQVQSYVYSQQDRRGVSYADEVAVIRARLDAQGSIPIVQGNMLVHSELMHQLEGWARSSDVIFVDIISALDASRDQLWSWVHLSPAANRIIAAKLSEAILADRAVQKTR